MKPVSFFLDHRVSNSRAVLTFVMKDGKVQKQGLNFIRGNVISMRGYARCKSQAERLLNRFQYLPTMD